MFQLDTLKAFYHIYKENRKASYDQRQYQKQTFGGAVSSGMYCIQLSPALFVESQTHAIRPPFVLSVHFCCMVCNDHTIDHCNASVEHAE